MSEPTVGPAGQDEGLAKLADAGSAVPPPPLSGDGNERDTEGELGTPSAAQAEAMAGYFRSQKQLTDYRRRFAVACIVGAGLLFVGSMVLGIWSFCQLFWFGKSVITTLPLDRVDRAMEFNLAHLIARASAILAMDTAGLILVKAADSLTKPDSATPLHTDDDS